MPDASKTLASMAQSVQLWESGDVGKTHIVKYLDECNLTAHKCNLNENGRRQCDSLRKRNFIGSAIVRDD